MALLVMPLAEAAQPAREMEKHYSKEQILEAYLNQIGFAHGWYGVESAARHYFGKGVSKLTLPEAATLAAMPKGPRAQSQAAQASRVITAQNYGLSALAPWFVDVVKVQAQRAEDRTGKAIVTRAIRALPPALDQRATFVVRDMMRDVVERGTATAIRRYLPSSIPVAGKTGTTNDNTDVWFIGLTPDTVAGVRLGFDKPKTITPGAAGGSLAAPIWGKMMSRYYAVSKRRRSPGRLLSV